MPDPWFKKRHHKRRLLQPQLVSQFAERMQPGARFFVMSDVKEAAESMVEVMNESPEYCPDPRPRRPASHGEHASSRPLHYQANPVISSACCLLSIWSAELFCAWRGHSFSDWTGEWEERTLPCATERETSCLGRGESISRAMFYRR